MQIGLVLSLSIVVYERSSANYYIHLYFIFFRFFLVFLRVFLSACECECSGKLPNHFYFFSSSTESKFVCHWINGCTHIGPDAWSVVGVALGRRACWSSTSHGNLWFHHWFMELLVVAVASITHPKFTENVAPTSVCNEIDMKIYLFNFFRVHITQATTCWRNGDCSGCKFVAEIVGKLVSTEVWCLSSMRSPRRNLIIKMDWTSGSGWCPSGLALF